MTRFDKRYCEQCMIEHWLETTNPRHEECHGEDYMPKDTATEYTRWNAGGIEVLPKVSTTRMSSCPARGVDWQIRDPESGTGEAIEDLSWLDLV
jgi:hypothetical protein